MKAVNLLKSAVVAFVLLSFSPTAIAEKSSWLNPPLKPRLSMFIGLDISGSFLKSKYYEHSIDFLAHYIYAHLRGLGGLEVPNVLFVGPIGGAQSDEAKTLFPIQAFENKNVEEIRKKLSEIFPKKKEDPHTDYNAFFRHVAETVKSKNLVLRPVSVVLISDGRPDFPGGGKDYRRIDLMPLENLARNVTVRLLYTSAVTGHEWQTKIPRRRVKIWTQDAEVMALWKDPKILAPGKPLEDQPRFLDWMKDNVDFGVRAKRVD